MTPEKAEEIAQKIMLVEEMAALGFLSEMGCLKLTYDLQEGWPIQIYYGYAGPYATRTAYIAPQEGVRITTKDYSDWANEVWSRHLREQALEDHYSSNPEALMYASAQEWWEAVVEGTHPTLGQMSYDELRAYLKVRDEEEVAQ